MRRTRKHLRATNRRGTLIAKELALLRELGVIDVGPTPNSLIIL